MDGKSYHVQFMPKLWENHDQFMLHILAIIRTILSNTFKARLYSFMYSWIEIQRTQKKCL